MCNRSTGVVLGIRVVEILRFALRESEKTGQLQLEALLLVSRGTSRTIPCLHYDFKHIRTTIILAEMLAIANHARRLRLAVGIR